MKDIKLSTACNHIVQEIITIDGISPNYTADLMYVSNMNKNWTSIVELSDYDGISMFALDFPGITNWSYRSDGKQIQFGTECPVDANMLFPDNNANLIPTKQYFMSYLATQATCPKCKNTKTTNDVIIDNDGRIAVVESYNKVRQQLLKVLLTVRGTNINDIEYGSTLSTSIGLKMTEYFLARLQFSIIEAINHLIDLQLSIGVPSNEQITDIYDLSVKQDTSDVRIVNLSLTVKMADYTTVSTNIGMRF